MAEKVPFDLVTPERILYSEPADMVVAPGEDGNFGVLPGHAPLLSTLRPGVVEVFENDMVVERFFVAGGVAEMGERGFTILAEEARNVAEIDAAAAAERLDAARAALSEAEEDDHPAAEAAVKVAEALVDAAR